MCSRCSPCTCHLLSMQNKDQKPEAVQPRGVMFPYEPRKIMP